MIPIPSVDKGAADEDTDPAEPYWEEFPPDMVKCAEA